MDLLLDFPGPSCLFFSSPQSGVREGFQVVKNALELLNSKHLKHPNSSRNPCLVLGGQRLEGVGVRGSPTQRPIEACRSML